MLLSRVLVLCLLPPAAPTAVGGDEALQRAAAEIDRIARREDSSARPENVALVARLREVLGEVAAAALGGGASAPGGWKLLRETATRRERTVAMECALLLIDLDREEALRELLVVVPEMEIAVRRKSLEHLQARGRSTGPVASELLRALEHESDPEALATLVRLTASLGTVEAFRALLEAAPPLAALRPEAVASDPPADAWQTVREALVEVLGEAREAMVVDWLLGMAWEEASLPGKESARKLVPMLESTGVSGRHRVEECLRHADERVLRAALAALERLGAEPSRQAIDDLARRTDVPAAAAARAALLLGKVEAAAGEARLLELCAQSSWEKRQAGVRALASLPASDAAFLRVVAMLDDPNREARAAAFASLRAFRRPGAVDSALRCLEPLRGRDRPLAIAYLEWASGKRLGEDHAAWAKWWREAKAGYRFPESSDRGK